MTSFATQAIVPPKSIVAFGAGEFKRSLWRVTLALVGMLAFGALPAAAEPAPDLILFNGRIFTADAGRPHAEALAIRGDRIAAVGDDASVRRLADGRTRLIDLGGRTVVPGLNDAHAHLFVAGSDEISLETEGYDPSWKELREVIGKATAQSPRGALLSGTIGTTVFYDSSIDRAALDQAAPDNPVILTSFDGHAALVNSSALAKLKIADDIADPAGGRFERDADGRLTGMVREYAVDIVWSRLAALTSDPDAENALRKQLDRAAKYGVTSIQDMPVAMSTERTAAWLAHIPTPVRVRLTRMNMTTPAGPDFQSDAAAPLHPAPLVTISGTKWVLDGVVFEASLTPRTAVADVAVTGGPHSFAGLPPLFRPAVIDDMLRDALHHGYQLQFHVYGTPAAVEILDALDRNGGARVWAGRRVRFEHGDGLTPDLIVRAKALGVIVSQQGSHLDILGIDAGLGQNFIDRLRTDRAEPLKSLLVAGVPLALGSDGPLNPWISILGATTDANRPDEAITREQAVIAYTAGSAYAEFAEREKGTLTPGKLADVAVLSQDVFTAAPDLLPKTRSVLTLVGGKVAYDGHVIAE